MLAHVSNCVDAGAGVMNYGPTSNSPPSSVCFITFPPDRMLLTVTGMVLFFCTFLALRSQDCGRPVEKIRDYELEDEEELFGG